MDCDWRKGEIIVRLDGKKEVELFQDNFSCKNVQEQWVNEFLLYIYFKNGVEESLEKVWDNIENIIEENEYDCETY